MANFPTLKSGVVNKYPTTATTRRATKVIQFVDDHEQRWKIAKGLASFNLVYSSLNGYDLSILRNFFRTTKGAFDNTFSITIGAITYDNCGFEDDTFEPTEGTRPNVYDITLRVKQTK
jgi:hypothetical protein